MFRTLPPRPDFTQLKHQAKDLLRAHERKDASACGVLRRLRRFSDKNAPADDAAILAAPLALHEAQYALAMEYGFASWNALKRHVEKVTNRPSPVRREKDRTYITGLEQYPIGGDGEHENSVIACIAGVMAALGEDELTYEYLMGASGAAFRVQHMWCPSAACAPCGYDCVPGAMKATGYRLTWIDTQPEGKLLSDGVEKAGPAIVASIERGVPALSASEESCLIVGYHQDGRRIIRNDDGGFQPSGKGYVEMDKWPWGIGIVEPKDVPMNRKEAVANSLRLAVMLARTERFEHYLSGFAAYEQWASELEQGEVRVGPVTERFPGHVIRFADLTKDNWFVPALGNGYTYGCLYATRLAAEKYLRDVAEDYENPIRSGLLEIAALYARIHEGLGRKRPEYACAWSLQPWRIGGPDKWTPQMRCAEAEALRVALSIERQAIEKIESLLPVIDPDDAVSKGDAQ